MTTAQLASRIGVSQPRAVVIEKSEALGSIKLDTLERAAHALDCQLVYALVPRKSLDEKVEGRAEQIARRRMRSAHHNMVLEAQPVSEPDEEEQFKRQVRGVLEKAGSDLWKDEYD